MKYLSSFLIMAGLMSSVYAALPASTDPTLINVPQLPGGIFLGGTGYYLQPSNNNGILDYASNNTSINNSKSSTLVAEDPSYDWGWGLTLGYIFPDTGNDISANYFRFLSDDNESSFGNFTPLNFVGPFDSALPIFGIPLNLASSQVEYNLHQADITVGQYINIGCRLRLHMLGGLRWGVLREELISSEMNTTTTPRPLIGDQADASSYFSGIGPLSGFDINYYLTHGIGIVGHVDSALLIGNQNANLNANAAFPAIFVGGSRTALVNRPYQFQADSTQRIVPVIDAKVGLDYTIVYPDHPGSDLTLEVGYQTNHYFNAIDQVLGSGVSQTVTAHKTSDLALNGFYASLIMHAPNI